MRYRVQADFVFCGITPTIFVHHLNQQLGLRIKHDKIAGYCREKRKKKIPRILLSLWVGLIHELGSTSGGRARSLNIVRELELGILTCLRDEPNAAGTATPIRPKILCNLITVTCPYHEPSAPLKYSPRPVSLFLTTPSSSWKRSRRQVTSTTVTNRYQT